MDDSHTSSTSRDSPPLLHAFQLPLTKRLGFTLHIIITIVFAAGADEERGGEERSGGSADFLDWGDGVWEGCCVVEDLLVHARKASVIEGYITGINEKKKVEPAKKLTVALWLPCWLIATFVVRPRRLLLAQWLL